MHSNWSTYCSETARQQQATSNIGTSGVDPQLNPGCDRWGRGVQHGVKEDSENEMNIYNLSNLKCSNLKCRS